MFARVQFLLAGAGMETHPAPQALARERLADEMPAIAVMTEALNHVMLRAPVSGMTMKTHLAFGAEAMTYARGQMPPAGMYAVHFTFESDAGGFAVRAHGHDGSVKDLHETAFIARANAAGGFDFETRNARDGIVRRETLGQARDVTQFFGAWLNRNFDAGTRRAVAGWAHKVMAGKMAVMPQPRTDWVGRFAAGQLTAR